MKLVKVVEIRTQNADGTPLMTSADSSIGATPYRVLTFAPFDMNFPDVVYPANMLAKRTIFTFDGLNAVKGSLVPGEIMSFHTDAPYSIDVDGGTRQVEKITVVALGAEDAIDVANNNLRDTGVTVIDATGAVTVRRPRVAVTPKADAPKDPSGAGAKTEEKTGAGAGAGAGAKN